MTTAKEPAKKIATHKSAARVAHGVSHGTHEAHAVHTAHHAAPHAAVHAPKGRYTEATGRRKTAIARVRITPGKGSVLVNGRDLKHYFSLPRLIASAVAPLEHLKLSKSFDVSVKVSGGGVSAQAEAIRHGLAQAIVAAEASWKPRLRAMGYMTRDSRMVERKKYGLKKARRAPQWAKR